MWDDVADLFADEGSVELGLNGVYAGKANIRKYLYSLTGGKPGLRPGEIMNHFQLSPVVTLADDGQSAKGRWRTIIQGGTYGKGSGGDWGEGVYENEYVQQNGVWKIKTLHFYTKFYAPYEGGWAHAPKDSALRYGKSKVKPSKATTVKYEPWPAKFTPPFHYQNPVATSYVFGGPQQQPASNNTTKAPKTVAELEAQVRALELRVERLKAVDDVERLNAQYGFYVDKSMQDAISALFTENATLEILGRGVFIGRDRIYEYMRRLGAPQVGTLFNHMQLGPVVHISDDGQSARIRVRLLVMFGQDGRAAQWGEGIYENTFVKDNGVWEVQQPPRLPDVLYELRRRLGEESFGDVLALPRLPARRPSVHRLRPVSGAVHAAVPLPESCYRKVDARPIVLFFGDGIALQRCLSLDFFHIEEQIRAASSAVWQISFVFPEYDSRAFAGPDPAARGFQPRLRTRSRERWIHHSQSPAVWHSPQRLCSYWPAVPLTTTKFNSRARSPTH
ncbi:MAG: nuclear transport factor 2 family protein [Gammaproteobacteria bacterium]